MPRTDLEWMQHAFALAQHAGEQGEVPVGAVLVLGDEIAGEGFNQPISNNDPSAHAEIQALRAGAITLNNYRLLNTTLYVTLEPCMMCAGAMVHARIGRLVYGAADPKTGAIDSVANLLDLPCHNHKVAYKGGVLAHECGQLLSDFFKRKR